MIVSCFCERFAFGKAFTPEKPVSANQVSCKNQSVQPAPCSAALPGSSYCTCSLFSLQSVMQVTTWIPTNLPSRKHWTGTGQELSVTLTYVTAFQCVLHSLQCFAVAEVPQDQVLECWQPDLHRTSGFRSQLSKLLTDICHHFLIDFSMHVS